MPYRIGTLIVCSLLFAACGGDPHMKAAEDATDVMEEMVEILESVTDKDSAEAAKGKLEKLRGQMKEMQAEQLKLEPPTPEQQERLVEYAKEMEPRTRELGERMMKAMMTISKDPEAMAVLDSTMKGMR